jgi:UDP-2,3-diacylglucosamine pyrophosphatase LpxH
MLTTSENITEKIEARTVLPSLSSLVPNKWLKYAHQRLTEALHRAHVLPVDSASKFVFFSDCHRGDNSVADAFAGNEDIFLRALAHYYEAGYTYIEVGDGDELWQNPHFSDIRKAHDRTFELLHAFNDDQRLHLVVGNHDVSAGRNDLVEKDGIEAHNSLVLSHVDTGHKLLVAHGHQADFVSDQLYRFSRRMVRFWKKLQLLGLGNPPNRADEKPSVHGPMLDFLDSVTSTYRQMQKVEHRIIDWVQTWQQAIICGHTHRPMSSQFGGAPYLNTGSCVRAGHITGIELDRGQASLISWHRTAGQGESRIVRQLLAPVQAIF